MSYGNLTYVNPNLVNYNNSHWSGDFTSKTIPSCGLPVPVGKVEASSASKIFGGNNAKINNNKSRIYSKMLKKNRIKMAVDSNILTRKRLTGKRKNKKNKKSKKQSKRIKKSRKRKLYKGGWSQYQNNVPLTPTYSVAGLQNNNFINSLANPPPHNILSNCTNCVDNYNHYTNEGFPSKGSY